MIWRLKLAAARYNTLEQYGEISQVEAHEPHRLRVARNNAHPVETLTNLDRWVQQTELLFNKYSERFHTSKV